MEIGFDITETTVEAISSIPSKYTRLALQVGIPWAEYLHDEVPFEELLEIVAAIPSHIECLDISSCRLYLRSVEELTRLMRAIPKTVKQLHLEDNMLRNKQILECVQVVAAIPKGIRYLNLFNNFDGFFVANYKPIFDVISSEVDTLILGDDSFLGVENGDGMEMQRMIKSLPKGVTTLGLISAFLYTPTADIRQMLLALPARIKALDLSKNDFFRRPIEECMAIMNAIPITVETLSLKDNLFIAHIDDLVDTLAAIPIGVKTLSLSGCFRTRGFVELESARFMAAIPKNVTALDLSNNNFYLSRSSLVQMMSLIPSHITTVNLVENYLDYIILSKILAAMPATVVKVYCDCSQRTGAHQFENLGFFFNFAKNELVRPAAFDKNKVKEKSAGVFDALQHDYQDDKISRPGLFEDVFNNKLLRFLAPRDAANLDNVRRTEATKPKRHKSKHGVLEDTQTQELPSPFPAVFKFRNSKSSPWRFNLDLGARLGTYYVHSSLDQTEVCLAYIYSRMELQDLFPLTPEIFKSDFFINFDKYIQKYPDLIPKLKVILDDIRSKKPDRWPRPRPTSPLGP